MTEIHRHSTNTLILDSCQPYLKEEQLEYKTSLENMFESYINFNLLGSSVEVLLEGVSESSSSLEVQKNINPEYMDLIKEQPWVVNFYTKAKKLNSARDLIPYYKEINRLIDINSLDNIDDFLFYIETKEMSDVLLPGILRLTLTKRNELHHWRDLKSRVEIELIERGLDSHDILRGLE
ncbi:hypothetical protein I6L41_17070 [Aeromonas sp. FDAARGOS 1411]|uniref:hypothetical protein n=1 Tax=Aeromonas TaxID=642 RepID=UPI001C2513AC|nr:hypothetical protein [Aeromonas sp. FDAARGOS 1411]QWZ94081.1 hypothetical protein I6L41_17070 [Aeromonas sp. FDAARGOS 1411]